MTTDCSLNYKFNTWKLQAQNMLWTEIVFDSQNNFCTQHVLPMFCKKKCFWQRFTCTECNSLQQKFGICYLYLGELQVPVSSDIIPPLSESLRDEKTTILILKRVFEILLEEVGPWLPLGASRNGKGISPRLQLLVFLFYVTSGIPFRHLAVASGKFII